MTDLRILADDLTGALDTAAMFAGDVPVFFDQPDVAAHLPVSVVATATRDIDPSALAASLAPALPWLAGAGVAFKKVDSLLRGNTFAETVLAVREGGFAELVFAPAFPQQGRMAVGGRLVVAQPGTASALHAASGVAMTDALRNAGLDARAVELVVPDIRGDDDLHGIAASVLACDGRRRLWCGSAGLAAALAQTLGLAARADGRAFPRATSPVLVLSASHHAVKQRQWAALLSAHPEAPTVRDGDLSQLDAVFDAADAPLRIVDLAPRQTLDAVQAATLLTRQFERVLRRARPPGTVLVVGGDTLRGLCAAAGTRGLMAGSAAMRGWGFARMIGGCWDAVPCHSRSGAFGDDDDLVRALDVVLPQSRNRG